MMNAMMRRTVEDGTATKAAFAWPSAGKTGTSQKSRDAWFVGYTANLTTGVWFGNDDGTPMKKVTGGALPALAWHEFMVAAHKGVPVAKLPERRGRARRAASCAPNPLVKGQRRGCRRSHAGVEPADRRGACPTGLNLVRRAAPAAEKTASIAVRFRLPKSEASGLSARCRSST